MLVVFHLRFNRKEIEWVTGTTLPSTPRRVRARRLQPGGGKRLPLRDIVSLLI
jgi:hypothetical protein